MTALITQAKESPSAAAQARQYLTFLLGGEIYAVETLRVKEIIEYKQLTVVPLMPPSVRGVINLRGLVVPVIDLLARFGKGVTRIARRSCNIILEVEDGEERLMLGVIVDAVNEVLELPVGEIEPPPSFGAHIRVEFIQGMAKVGSGFVILLDVAKVLCLNELNMLAECDISRPISPSVLLSAQGN